jgi:hypothetical protein
VYVFRFVFFTLLTIILFSCLQVVRAFMLVVAVFTAAVTARPDSAGIVELFKGFAYGKVCINIVQH